MSKTRASCFITGSKHLETDVSRCLEPVMKHSPSFLTYYIKDNEKILCQDLLTILENTNSDLKVHALHYANELLVRFRLSFQNLLQTRSTWKNNTKKCLRVQTTINHFYILTFLCFSPQYQRERKCVFFFRARAEKGIA